MGDSEPKFDMLNKAPQYIRARLNNISTGLYVPVKTTKNWIKHGAMLEIRIPGP